MARENGFSYIINSLMVGGGGVLLFTDEKYNISDLVLKNLWHPASEASIDRLGILVARLADFNRTKRYEINAPSTSEFYDPKTLSGFPIR